MQTRILRILGGKKEGELWYRTIQQIQNLNHLRQEAFTTLLMMVKAARLRRFGYFEKIEDNRNIKKMMDVGTEGT